jgi:TRAP transporter TAXI family solute receptor
MLHRALTVAGLLAAAVAVAAAWDGDARAQELKFFRIGTGSTAGTYFPVGSLIASTISNPPGSRPCDQGGSCGVPGLIAAAQATAGSVANIEAVAEGALESGLAQADVVHWAYFGEGIYSDKQRVTSLRAIANLYPESVHLVVRKGAAIASVPELRGQRVSLDTPGAGTQVDAYLILEAYGLSDQDLHPVFANPGLAMDMMMEDKLEAFFFVGGYPAKAIVDLAAAGKVELVAIAGPEADALRARYSFFARDRIPSDAYEGTNGVETLSVGAQWVVGAEIDDELVYQITRALWHPNSRLLLDGGHAKARLIRLETALEGVSIPLHPGAERYYREAGLIE